MASRTASWTRSLRSGSGRMGRITACIQNTEGPESMVSASLGSTGGKPMETTALLKAFCSAVERRDGKAFANLFTEDSVYHDIFYGAFKGRQKIGDMVDDWFHRTARDFRWEMFRPVTDGKTLYAYYTFSY